MNIYGSLMDIFDSKNKDIFDSKTVRITYYLLLNQRAPYLIFISM